MLTVILSTDCTPIEPVTSIYGELLTWPEEPVREGKYFTGWLEDIHLTQKWDFETDTVKGNMTLYAKWSDTPVGGSDVGVAPCLICHRENMLIPGVSLCWICLLILILILLVIFVTIHIIFARKKAKKNKLKGKI